MERVRPEGWHNLAATIVERNKDLGPGGIYEDRKNSRDFLKDTREVTIMSALCSIAGSLAEITRMLEKQEKRKER